MLSILASLLNHCWAGVSFTTQPPWGGKAFPWASNSSQVTLPALTCLGSPTVNSYRRLWDTGFWAPVYADWGYQNRTCSVRVSAPGRVEYRSVDSSHNPYLLGGGILKAFDDGLDKNMDPGEPEKQNIYEAMKAGKKVDKLPLTLGEAIDRLDNDEIKYQN